MKFTFPSNAILYHLIWILPSIGRGCASVLNTYLSNGIVELSPNSKYKYLRVSPRKNVSILSLLRGGTVVTSSRDVYPPLLTFVCLSNASKISHPHARYLQYVHINILSFFFCSFFFFLIQCKYMKHGNKQSRSMVNVEGILLVSCDTIQDEQWLDCFGPHQIMTIQWLDYYVINVFWIFVSTIEALIRIFLDKLGT